MKTIQNLILSFENKAEDELIHLKDFYSTSAAPADVKDQVILALDKILNRRELQEIAKIEISELSTGEV